MGKLFDYLVFPLLLPAILLWLLVARILSFLVPLLLPPLTWVLARRLSWACPFIPYIWKQQGWFLGTMMRGGFEWTYCMNVVRRFLTLPLRRRTADFFIVGFPKAGTTSMAAYLKLHPAIDGIDGLQWHEALNKESHFFNGALGRHNASSKAAYRSYFPTVLRRWWVERVRRAGKWLCFDACPVNACLDYTAARMAAINPDAKLIFMLRDPVSGAFSAEIMLRNLGVPLQWSLMEDVRPADPRFAETPEDVQYWQQVAALSPSDPLPEDLMRKFYHDPYALLRSGRYAERVAPFLQHFKRENIMFIDFTEFTSNTESVVRQTLEFVGADPSLLHFRTLPPGMQGERRGRRIHPSVKRKLTQYFALPNDRLFAMLGRDFQWCNSRGAVDATSFMRPGPVNRPPANLAPAGPGPAAQQSVYAHHLPQQADADGKPADQAGAPSARSAPVWQLPASSGAVAIAIDDELQGGSRGRVSASRAARSSSSSKSAHVPKGHGSSSGSSSESLSISVAAGRAAAALVDAV